MSLATPAEHRFKEACRELVMQGTHPTPGRIHRELGRCEDIVKRGNLNGREVRWLRVDLGVSPTRASDWMAELGPCRLYCCKAEGDLLPSELALACGNGHLELVRVTMMGGAFFVGSGADQCTFCDEWRDQDTVREALRRALDPIIGSISVDGHLSASRPRLLRVEPGTATSSESVLAHAAAALAVGMIAALVFLVFIGKGWGPF